MPTEPSPIDLSGLLKYPCIIKREMSTSSATHPGIYNDELYARRAGKVMAQNLWNNQPIYDWIQVPPCELELFLDTVWMAKSLRTDASVLLMFFSRNLEIK